MTDVTDAIGRTFKFSRIRFKFDENLLQEAAIDIVDETVKRGQIVFDRYCALHLRKYGRNFEPMHFSGGQLLDRYKPLYANPSPSLRITLEVTGAMYDKYIGAPIDEIEASIRRDPAHWIRNSQMIAE